MLRRGCTLIVVLFGALFAAYWWFFTRYFEGNVELVRVLLAAHPNLYAQTTTGATALSEAIRGEHAEVVALLRAAGADRPAERPEGEPPSKR